MIQKQARRLQAVFLASDVAATCAALLAAYVIRFETVWPIPLGPQPLGNYASLLPVIARPLAGRLLLPPSLPDAARPLLHRRGARHRHGRLARRRSSSSASSRSGGAWSFNRALLILFLLLDILLVALGRFAIWRYLEKVWAAGVGVRRALVVGAGDAGRAIADKLLDHPATGLKPVGFADDDAEQAGRGVPRARRPRDDRRRPGAPRRARGRHDLPRPPGRRVPDDARHPEGRRERDGRHPVRPRPLPVRHVQGGRGGLRRPPGHQPDAAPPRGVELAREADDGHRPLGGRPRRPGGPPPVRRARDLARGPGPGLLHAGADGARRAPLPDPEVPLDARRAPRTRPARSGRRRGTPGGPASGPSSGARRSTRCRSS